MLVVHCKHKASDSTGAYGERERPLAALQHGICVLYGFASALVDCAIQLIAKPIAVPFLWLVPKQVNDGTCAVNCFLKHQIVEASSTGVALTCCVAKMRKFSGEDGGFVAVFSPVRLAQTLVHGLIASN